MIFDWMNNNQGVAEWFSGMITTFGILLSLWWNYQNTRTKLFISLNDIHWSIMHKMYTRGTLIFRIYNSASRSVLIDEVGICIKFINDEKIKRLYVPLHQKQDFRKDDSLYLSSVEPYSDYSRRFEVDEVISQLVFYSFQHEEYPKIITATVIPYIKSADGRYLHGNKTMKIDITNKSIDGAIYINFDDDN